MDNYTEQIATDPGVVDFQDYSGNNSNKSHNCSMFENDYCESQQDYEDRMLRHIYPDKYEWILIFAHFVVFVIGIVGNALVVVAVFRNTAMRTITNYFIVNLAVADLMVILFCLVPTVLWDVTETWFFGPVLCKIVLYFQTVSVSVSVLTLTVISVERWYAICHPLKFKATTSRAKKLILIIWIVSLLVDIPELLVLETQPRKMRIDTFYFTQCAPNWSPEMEIMYIIFRTVVLFAVPLLFISFACYRMVRVLWSSSNIPGTSTNRSGSSDDLSGFNLGKCSESHRATLNRIQATSVSQVNAAEYVLNSRRKAAKMVVVVVTMFAFCYLPVHIYSIILLFTNLPRKDYIAYIVMVSHWLCYANSAINPIIYNFMSANFRKEFTRAFKSFGFTKE